MANLDGQPCIAHLLLQLEDLHVLLIDLVAGAIQVLARDVQGLLKGDDLLLRGLLLLFQILDLVAQSCELLGVLFGRAIAGGRLALEIALFCAQRCERVLHRLGALGDVLLQLAQLDRGRRHGEWFFCALLTLRTGGKTRGMLE